MDSNVGHLRRARKPWLRELNGHTRDRKALQRVSRVRTRTTWAREAEALRARDIDRLTASWASGRGEPWTIAIVKELDEEHICGSGMRPVVAVVIHGFEEGGTGKTGCGGRCECQGNRIERDQETVEDGFMWRRRCGG